LDMMQKRLQVRFSCLNIFYFYWIYIHAGIEGINRWAYIVNNKNIKLGNNECDSLFFFLLTVLM
jgi:hypothetical protein